MQTENFGERNLAAEAQAAAAVLGQLAEQQRSAWPEGSFVVPRTTALNGLAVAIPLALSLWALLGLIFWLLAR